jgi:thioredoxin-dependent peroxiredoxin
MKIGEKLPNIVLEATGDQKVNLSKLKGTNIIIYFYPKDSTPGCTTEGQDFKAQFNTLKELGTIVFGVSRDSLQSHLNFKNKQAFPFELISDPNEVLCQLFGVIKLKKLYGREYMGIERSTFLFDKKGVLVEQWRKIRVKGHVEQVMDAVRELSS